VDRKNPKHQIPNSKQYSISRFGIWNLVLGVCLGFGAWDLKFLFPDAFAFDRRFIRAFLRKNGNDVHI
jgi:hypothetical protein